MESFSIDRVVGQIVKDYIQVPDFSNIRDEIEEFITDNEDRFFMQKTDMMEHEYRYPERLSRILFTTMECVVVEHLELTESQTRFGIQKIKYEDWKDLFINFITEGHPRYSTCRVWLSAGWRML